MATLGAALLVAIVDLGVSFHRFSHWGEAGVDFGWPTFLSTAHQGNTSINPRIEVSPGKFCMSESALTTEQQVHSTWELGGLTPKQLAKVRKLATTLQEEFVGRDHDFAATDSGDAGLDLVGWLPLSDAGRGRLAVFAAWQEERLKTTTLRETLARQSGMYRVAAKISDEQINDVVGTFCRCAGGCLRTILWRRTASGSVASSKLPPAKFDPNCDQAQPLCGPGLATPATTAPTVIPLLCQEACNLLVNECRKMVKGEKEL